MDLLQAVVLGIVQGLTEFLPISSSAHLRIVPELLGWQDPGAAFTAVIQIGTLAAVLAYFREDIVRIGRAWTLALAQGQPLATLDARMGWMMIVGTVPIVVFGLAFKNAIETSLRSLYVIAWSMIGLTFLLVIAEIMVRYRKRAGRTQKQLEDVTWTDAILTGLAQTMALVPGSSRSGVTITAGLFREMSRETAARFSFLLSLPAVFAAGAFQLYKARDKVMATSDDAMALAVCTIVSGVVGYASIAFLLHYLKTHSTFVFIAYRLLAGGLILFLLWRGTLEALPTAAAAVGAGV